MNMYRILYRDVTVDVVPVCSWCVTVDVDRAVGVHVKLWVCIWIYTYVTVWGGVSMIAWGRRLMINGANIAVNP